MEKTDRTLPPPASRSAAHDEQDEAEDEDEEAPEDVRVVQEIASFNNITVWGHESIPSSTEDPYSKGIEEWMTFAQSVRKPLMISLIWLLMEADTFVRRFKLMNFEIWSVAFGCCLSCVFRGFGLLLGRIDGNS